MLCTVSRKQTTTTKLLFQTASTFVFLQPQGEIYQLILLLEPNTREQKEKLKKKSRENMKGYVIKFLFIFINQVKCLKC